MNYVYFFIGILACVSCFDENFETNTSKDVTPKSLNAFPAATKGFAQGKVLETFESGGYTYIKVESNGKEVWGAGPTTPIKKGSVVKFDLDTPMTNFRSNTLKRTFSLVYFAKGFQIIGADNSAPVTAQEATAKTSSMNPHAKAMTEKKPVKVATVIKIEKAKNGKTVADIYAEKESLSGKSVIIKAQIVKYNPGIMGKNWLHLQDGSGSPGSNDLVVTTLDTAKIGDVMFVKGLVVINKVLGKGYKFDVLIENAKLTLKQP